MAHNEPPAFFITTRPEQSRGIWYGIPQEPSEGYDTSTTEYPILVAGYSVVTDKMVMLLSKSIPRFSQLPIDLAENVTVSLHGHLAVGHLSSGSSPLFPTTGEYLGTHINKNLQVPCIVIALVIP